MAGESLVVWGVYALLVTAVTAPLYRRRRARERRAEEAERYALEYGLKEPASLHPVVDPNRCIGLGNCTKVCWEGDLIGIRNGQAFVISPARCVGHGACERACPVEAIQLVFGTAKRGVDLPRVRENYETNVPGIYIVGELGGMGLIRNAFEQGRLCVEGIAREKRSKPADAHDVVIVGCGPAGLSASLHCQQRGLDFVTIEKEDIGGTVRHYPRKKLVMTAPFTIPGYGKLKRREIQKEELISLWEEVIARTGLRVNSGETVVSVTRTPDECFTVETNRGRYKTRRVILAIGRRGVPRKLGVPGEDLPKVAYALKEPEAYRNDRILVVGGGDSAVEAALALAQEPGNQVTISYRKDKFSRLKPANLERVERAIASRAIDVLWATNVVEIQPELVVYKDASGATHTLANDYVFVFIGGELPTKFLAACGVEIDTKFGEPRAVR